MKYDELKRLAEKKKVSISELARSVDMTLDGFRKSINTQSMCMGRVPTLCSMLGISPNMMFGYRGEHADVAIENGGMMNNNVQHVTTGSDSVLEALQAQLAEKDRQIAKLLDLLSK